ncbi:DMT family transporter [Rhodalgimonas zhirmunskyi]|uniref:DMT family transporter n=1 Tax=Rhodalgimonas zhirmunskyi TaxID=2964767 RepID=A0AAJ1X641_9RHOB|nr:DMT family transporter [Rhodoalgimonas zhirmunskyi]MDQ2094789.1 DMT family transporter [Rhodoalgimonas zhirmunskyi]
MTRHLPLIAVLLVLGAGWGLTMPLTKIAVDGGYRHFGMIFWQVAIGALVLFTIQGLRRRPVRFDRERLPFYLVIALLGTVLPNLASFEATRHLPAGVMSVAIATVPMFALPVALMLGTDRASVLRILGLVLGLSGVAILAGPMSGPMSGAGAGSVHWGWLLVALIGPVFYGAEGNVVARWGTGGAGPVEVLAGAMVLAALITLPLALVTGTFIDPRPPWGLRDLAVLGSALINAFVYAGYVWLVGRAGAVFAGQVAYLVTGFGVVWAMVLLGERYAPGFWAAFGLMFAGLFLVQPRDNLGLRGAREPQAPSTTAGAGRTP